MPSNAIATRLCLSGGESRKLLDIFADFGVPHIQVSFYYLKRVFGDPEEFVNYAKNFQTVIIDHGLIYHKYKSEAEKKEFLEDYEKYVSILPPRIYSAVVTHPDIALDKSIDTSKLIYNLDDLEDLFEGDMKAVFSQVEYIGVGNKIATDEERMGFIAGQASKNDTKLHAFGTSSIKVLKKWPFYSANSSSWRTGSRYANTYIYEGATRGLRIFQPTDKSNLEKTDQEKRVIRTRLKNMVEAKQPPLYKKVDWESLLGEDNSWEVDKANMTQWMLYQEELALDIGRNKYWLTQEQKDLISLRRKEVLGKNATGGNTRVGEEEDIAPRIDNTPIEKRKESIEVLDIEDSNTPLVEGDIMDSNTAAVPVPQDMGSSIALSTAHVPGGAIGRDLSQGGTKRLKETDIRAIAPRMCDFCILANRCPKYDPGAPCAFGLTETYLPADIDEHIEEDVGELLAMQRDRVLQGYMEEKMDASGLNKDVTNNIKLYTEMVNLYRESKKEEVSITAKAKGTGLLQMFTNKPQQ